MKLVMQLGLRQADSTNSMMWENMYERETHDIGICEIFYSIFFL